MNSKTSKTEVSSSTNPYPRFPDLPSDDSRYEPLTRDSRGIDLAADSAKGIITLAIFLTGIGLVAIYGSSAMKGAQQFQDSLFFLRKQALFAGVGFGVIFVLQKIPFRWIERATLPTFIGVCILLALIFVPGVYRESGGAYRWLALGPISGQPAEFAKLALVLFLAKSLARPNMDCRRFFSGIMPHVGACALISGLLLYQRDLGTPVLLFAVTFVMLYVAGLAKRYILLLGGAVGIITSIAVIVEPFRVARLMSFVDPWTRFKTGGFQIIQSFLAFKNGGLWGVGLGESKQKLFFLPAAETDFILSVIGEELGLLGVLLICAMFAFLIWLGFKVVAMSVDPYRKFLALGLTMTLAIQASMNMGVTMGLLPTKGIPLPFVSSGNSSLIVFLILAGILARLAKEAKTESDRPPR